MVHVSPDTVPQQYCHTIRQSTSYLYKALPTLNGIRSASNRWASPLRSKHCSEIYHARVLVSRQSCGECSLVRSTENEDGAKLVDALSGQFHRFRRDEDAKASSHRLSLWGSITCYRMMCNAIYLSTGRLRQSTASCSQTGFLRSTVPRHALSGKRDHMVYSMIRNNKATTDRKSVV